MSISNMQKRSLTLSLRMALFIFTVFSVGYSNAAPNSSSKNEYDYELFYGQSFSVTSINAKTISINGKKFAMNSATKVYNSDGIKAGLNDIKVGSRVRVVFSSGQRYVNWPTLSAIYLL